MLDMQFPRISHRPCGKKNSECDSALLGIIHQKPNRPFFLTPPASIDLRDSWSVKMNKASNTSLLRSHLKAINFVSLSFASGMLLTCDVGGHIQSCRLSLAGNLSKREGVILIRIRSEGCLSAVCIHGIAMPVCATQHLRFWQCSFCLSLSCKWILLVVPCVLTLANRTI